MSLAFDNSSAANTELKMAAGGAAAIESGAYTVLILWQLNGNTTIFSAVDNGGFAQRQMVIDTNQVFLSIGANGVPLPGTPANGKWYWVGVTKAAGSGVAERCHVALYDGSGSFVWTHSTPAGTTRNDFSAAVNIFLGGWGLGGSKGHRAIAVGAALTSALSDLEVEAACTDALSTIASATPSAFWSMQQAIAGSPIQDLSAAGTADEVSRGIGVTAAADPPNVNFSLSPPVVPSGLAVPVAFGAPVIGQPAAAPSGLAVPVALGQPTIALPGVQPAGLGVLVGLGLLGGVASVGAGEPLLTITRADRRTTFTRGGAA